jgi:hypothetical protein
MKQTAKTTQSQHEGTRRETQSTAYHTGKQTRDDHSPCTRTVVTAYDDVEGC